MIYISPENEYPRHYGDIQLASPSWNLGDDLPEGWHKVEQTEMPTPSENEVALESQPKEIKGVWTQQWTVRDMTPEEIERRDAPETAKAKLIALGLTEAEVEALVRGLVR